jgi:hypothetical protein
MQHLAVVATVALVLVLQLQARPSLAAGAVVGEELDQKEVEEVAAVAVPLRVVETLEVLILAAAVVLLAGGLKGMVELAAQALLSSKFQIHTQQHLVVVLHQAFLLRFRATKFTP